MTTFARAAPAALMLALILAPAGCKPDRQPVFNPDGLAGPRVTPAIPKPEFTLTGTDGKPFDFQRETEGDVALLFFGYTHCPDVCPVHLANIAAALQKLSPQVNNAVKVVFVTTDPDRDTPQVLRTWLDKFDPRFIGLRGDTATVGGIMRRLKLGAAIPEPATGGGEYTIGHSSLVLAFTRDDSAHVVYPFGIRQADWARDLPRLVGS
ncbi:MAG TPA: SCO family protein [Gemmatimonadales bacterium]|nr:SCO family protein [Gemmatimonadales bacterium]